jgi:hypothetical protein
MNSELLEKLSVNKKLRNSELLQKLERHPLKAALARALDAAEMFAGDAEYLSLNKDLSPRGLDNARRAKLRAAVRDNRDARGPMNELQTKLDAKRKAVAIPKFDPNDVVGFLRRQELRAALRAAANTGQRELLLDDPTFADACLEQPAALSGLQPQQIGDDKSKGNQDFILVEAVKKRRLETLFAPQLAEIKDLEKTIAEATEIFDLSLVDMKLHSGMDDRTFTEFVAPIMNRKNAPWLVKNGDAIVRVRPELKGTPQLNQPATADEIADGKFYKSESEYLADRAA